MAVVLSPLPCLETSPAGGEGGGSILQPRQRTPTVPPPTLFLGSLHTTFMLTTVLNFNNVFVATH